MRSVRCVREVRGRNIGQSVASGAKRDRIEELGCVQDQRVQRLLYREDDVEVGNVESGTVAVAA
jgi:hypothetical protein